MATRTLLLRWSWRDLRAHWAKVLAIALVIAIGTGGYAGLTSTTRWREVSYDVSYSRLAMYDLRVDLAAGSTTAERTLADVVAGIPSAASVAAVEERLIVPTQVDASSPGEAVLVRGEIIGSDFSDGGPQVNGYHALTGRLLTAADSGEPNIMIERTFARFYQLDDHGTLAVSGDRRLTYVGQATTPEYFTVAPEGEMFMSEATFAAVFTTLATAQDLAGMPGQVNNLVLTLTDGADRDTVAAQLEAALAAASVGATVATRDDNLSYTALTTDVDQDQAMFNALAMLLLVGAVGAAVNLVHRLAEQQRREIGIGMALGVRPWVLAVRPLLVSAQIALLGVVFGVVVGTLIGNAMGAVFKEFIPLPVWDTSFQYELFGRVAVVGLALPFAASALPVWRAVRVAPVQAIKPAHLGNRDHDGGRRRRLAHNTFAVMPFRNLARQPRRTVLTVAGIAAAITVLAGFLGIMDSVFGAVDTAEQEAVGAAPDRMTVGLDGFYLAESPQVRAVGAAETVGIAEPTLRLAGAVSASAGAEPAIDVFVELAHLEGGMWRPTITAGSLDGRTGLVLSEKAAADLGVDIGDSVLLRHPRRQGPASYILLDSELPLLATHPHPVRSVAYMDLGDADLFNLAGVTNALNVLPAAGATSAEVQQELFQLDQVAAVQSVTAVTEAVRDAFDQMLGIIQVMVAAVLLLALLIAFNTAAINLEARAREHATMFAFGVKVRTAVRMAITESLVVGTAATLLGVAGGAAMVWWMTQRLLTETLPDFSLQMVLRGGTVAVVAVMGIVVVALAPLLTVRRMRRLDLPGTLRLME